MIQGQQTIAYMHVCVQVARHATTHVVRETQIELFHGDNVQLTARSCVLLVESTGASLIWFKM